MSDLTGSWRNGAAPELQTAATAECVQDNGIHVVVLPGSSRAPHAQLVLDQYLRAGMETVLRHCADCAFVIADENSRELLLVRDELGTIPLYYGVKRQDTAFGMRVADVARALGVFQLVPNRAALAALLVDHAAAGHDQTYFQDVFAVPPGRAVRIRDGVRTTLTAPPTASVDAAATFEEAAEQFSMLFRAAVRARLSRSGSSAVLVSGGLDSAAIICVAHEVADVVGINYAPEEDPAADESHYIDMLRRQGVRIERVPFYPSMDWHALEDSVLCGETPAFDRVPQTLQRAAAAGRAFGADTLLIGTWGDQVLAPFPPPQHAQLPIWRLFELAHSARAYHAYMEDVPAPDIRRLLWRQWLRRRTPSRLLELRRQRRRQQSVFDLLAAEFPPAEVQARETLSDALYHNVQSAAHTEALAGTTQWGYAQRISVRLPFVDARLLAMLRTLSPAFMYHDHVLKALLRRALRDTVPSMLLDRRDKGDYTAAVQRGALPNEAVWEKMDELRRLVDFGLLSRSSAQKTLAKLRSAPDISWTADQTASDLLAVDIWLRLFCENPL